MVTNNKGLSSVVKNHQTAVSFLTQPVTALAGIGSKSGEGLSRLKINTVKDIIFTFPYRYEVISLDSNDTEKQILSGSYEGSSIIRTRKGKSIFKAVFKGINGYFFCLWLNYNNSYPSSVLHLGSTYYMYGSVTQYDGVMAIFHPEIINKNDLGSIRPIYTVPAGLSMSVYRKALNIALEKGLKQIQETLPKYLLDKYKYPNIQDAVYTLHNPETIQNVASIMARTHTAYERFIYEELFYLQLVMQLNRKTYNKSIGIKYNINKDYLLEINEVMPFKLTAAQKKALIEIFNDMASKKQMNRLVQGDVGSGKTIIAFIAAAVAVHNGYQVIIIAPTEVLAEQHYINAEKFFMGGSVCFRS